MPGWKTVCHVSVQQKRRKSGLSAARLSALWLDIRQRALAFLRT